MGAETGRVPGSAASGTADTAPGEAPERKARWQASSIKAGQNENRLTRPIQTDESVGGGGGRVV